MAPLAYIGRTHPSLFMVVQDWCWYISGAEGSWLCVDSKTSTGKGVEESLRTVTRCFLLWCLRRLCSTRCTVQWSYGQNLKMVLLLRKVSRLRAWFLRSAAHGLQNPHKESQIYRKNEALPANSAFARGQPLRWMQRFAATCTTDLTTSTTSTTSTTAFAAIAANALCAGN